MNKKEKERYEELAKILKALAHPSRIFVVEELAKGERCVCELVEMIGDDFSTVSKHLALLKNAGLVASEKRGNNVYYSLRIKCLDQLLNCVERALLENAHRQLRVMKRG